MLKLLFCLLCAAGPAAAGAQSGSNCFIDFNGKGTGLTAGTAERLPEGAEKFRVLKTEAGEKEATRIDGYRILYRNEKNAPFVNLKVERSEAARYQQDTLIILADLRYLNAHAKNMETSDLIVLHYNGYTVYGLSRNSLAEGSILGSFIMFPGDGLTVYFDFQNLRPEYRNFETLDDYKSQRNRFLESYTAFLRTCQKR